MHRIKLLPILYLSGQKNTAEEAAGNIDEVKTGRATSDQEKVTNMRKKLHQDLRPIPGICYGLGDEYTEL